MKSLRARMIDDMRIRKYSSSTIKSYVWRVACFARFFSRDPAELGPEEIRTYQLALIDEGISRSLFVQSVCALRFFYGTVLERDWTLERIPFPRRQTRLPLVVSAEVVGQVLDAIRNPKHRTLAEIMYGSGLRLTEAMRLRAKDIDSSRMVLRVEQGKGKKDRHTVLPASLLKRLRGHWEAYRPRGPWLFPGKKVGQPLSAASMQKAMLRARERARIEEPVTCHTLRHCFATHLMERGVDIRTIQVLLGHRYLSTTSRYLHLAADKVRETGATHDLLEDIVETS